MTKILFIFTILIILCLFKIFKINDNISENFIGNNNVKNKSTELSFKKINSNKLYYGLDCMYIKNDTFYDALKKCNFKVTKNI